jgi:hypothetical protein
MKLAEKHAPGVIFHKYTLPVFEYLCTFFSLPGEGFTLVKKALVMYTG